MVLGILNASLPGSAAFLIVAFTIGLVLLRKPRTNRLGRRWLLVLLLLYVVFSVPATARWLAAPLGWGFQPLQNRAAAGGANAIVVLDGGTGRYRTDGTLIELPSEPTVLRALETIRVYRLLDDPVVFVTGGAPRRDSSWGPEASSLRQLLLAAGVRSDRIVLDSTSVNTRAHAVNVTRMLRARGFREFVLVTSRSHMRRATWAFRARQTRPVSSPAMDPLDHSKGWLPVWPSTAALEFTRAVFHEYLGIGYYFVRGYF